MRMSQDFLYTYSINWLKCWIQTLKYAIDNPPLQTGTGISKSVMVILFVFCSSIKEYGSNF